MKALERLAFLVEGSDSKVQLTPILSDYCKDAIDEESMNELYDQICAYYHEFH